MCLLNIAEPTADTRQFPVGQDKFLSKRIRARTKLNSATRLMLSTIYNAIRYGGWSGHTMSEKIDMTESKQFDSTNDKQITRLDRIILENFGDRVILKPLTRWNEAYKEFPRYVMEYLVRRYVDAEEPVAGPRKSDKILSEHYTESAKKELIKSRIKENGEYTLLGQLTVRLDQARDHYWADVPALGDNTVRIAPRVLEQYRDILMTSGAWGTMVVEYDATYEIKSRKYPFYVREFTPLQYTRLDLDDYIAKRPLFTEEEWLDLLVQSIGFNPARFERRVKLLMLLR